MQTTFWIRCAGFIRSRAASIIRGWRKSVRTVWPALRADLEAAYALCRHQRLKICLLSIMNFARFLLSSVREKRYVGRKLYLKRMASCRRCPIFNKRLKTCGTARADHPDQMWTPPGEKPRPMGCHCYLPLKNWLEVRCWLHDQGIDYGWLPELDSE